jgi:acyl-CoA thioesterase-1
MFFRLFLIVIRSLTRVSFSRSLTLSLLSLSFVAYPFSANAENPKILVFGDSLSAGFGVAKQQAWVTLLQTKLDSHKYHYDVINASISGETTSGGLSRFSMTLAKTNPNIVILELGANDGLRGLPITEMTKNLNTMIELTKKYKAKLLLLGMRIPPNYGLKYTENFHNTYQILSEKHLVPLVPFLLENIAAEPNLIQDDGLHPNALAQPIMLNNVWPKLQQMLRK